VAWRDPEGGGVVTVASRALHPFAGLRGGLFILWARENGTDVGAYFNKRVDAGGRWSPLDDRRLRQLVSNPERAAPEVVQHPADLAVLDLQVDGGRQVEVGAVQLGDGHADLLRLLADRVAVRVPSERIEGVQCHASEPGPPAVRFLEGS
jgi:hypothetical protein